jgi:general secretion pathway protein H
LVAAVQKGLAHANTIGKPVRLAIDLGAGRLLLEESNSSVALRAKPSENPDDEAEEASQVQAAVAAAQAAGEDFMAYASSPSSGFTPIDILGQEGDAPGRVLDPSIKITKVQTEHDDEGISEGVAYIYFWPGGVTERAIVQLGRGTEDDGVTVEVSPLTGRARISRGKVELPEPIGFGDEYSEREEL